MVFLQKLTLALAPIILGAITYLFADVITLKADVRSQSDESVTLRQFIINRLDRIENKLDKLYERR